MRQALLIVTALGVASWSRLSSACAVCGCGDSMLVATDPVALNGSLRFGLDADALGVSAVNESEPQKTDRLRQFDLKLSGTYKLGRDLSLLVLVPLTGKSISTPGEPTLHTAGLGDDELYGGWVVLDLPDFARRSRQTLALSLGTSRPTGGNGARAGGERLDEHVKLGTGA